MNENLKPVEKLTPFTKMIMTIGTLPSSFYASMSYYESMVWLYEYLKNQVIPAVNNNGEAVKELQTAFTTLQNWIEHYFDNLDLQQEVNTKLDEMAEDGTLADMIAEYIKMQGQLVYNSVEEMKNAENIQNGSFLKTYGFYSYGDGGGALYKARTITNEDTIDNMTLFALHDVTLVAELIYNSEIVLDCLGAKEEENFDCKPYFDKAFTLGIKKIKLLCKRYRINGSLNIPIDTTIEGINNYDNGSIITEIGNSSLLLVNQRCITLKNLLLTNATENEISCIRGTVYENNHYNLLLDNLRITGFNIGIELGGSIWWDTTINDVRVSLCNKGIQIINCFNMYIKGLYTDRCSSKGVELYGTNTINFESCNFGSIAGNLIDISFGGATEKNNLIFNNCNFEYDTQFETSVRSGFINVARSTYNACTCELLFTNCRFTINQQTADIHSMAFNGNTRVTFINCFYYPNNTTDYPNAFFNAEYPPAKTIGSLRFLGGNSTMPRPNYGDSNKLCVHDLENEKLPSCFQITDASTFTNIQNGSLILTTSNQKINCYLDNQWKTLTTD